MENKDTQAFLGGLYRLGINIRAEGERLKIDAPKGSISDELRASLTQRKAELLDFLAARDGESRLSMPIPPVEPGELPYASFAQQRLWFLDQLVENKSHIYNVPLFLRAAGKLDTAVFLQAVNEIIRRHDVLRTIFPQPRTEDKEPRQQALPELVLEAPLIDLTHLDEAAREERIARIAGEEAEYAFDLSRGPLVRLSIVKAAEEDHVLLFHFHHIVFDGLSIKILLRELGVLYAAFLRNQPSPLAPLEIQYADFSQWQRNGLRGANLEKQLAFWRSHLEGAPPFLELPGDRPRPAIPLLKGARLVFELDGELTQNLRTLSQDNHATLFMTLQAIFAIFLARHANQADLVLGMPVANRGHRQLEPLIGFFANTLALRFRVEPQLRFPDFLRQVKDTLIASLEHQSIPFEKLVDELKIERNLSHNPLFQVMFTFQEAYLENFTLPGLTFSALNFEQTDALFDLTLMVREYTDKLVCIFEYSTDLFDAATMERMSGRFQTLLGGVVAQPTEKLARLPVLTEAEKQMLLVDFNQTAMPFPQDKPAHRFFEDRAEKHAERIAAVFNDERLTYRELNARANQLAHHLIGLNVRPGVLVGMCLERSLDTLVAVLGILKAGDAYVPLDPNYPDERLQFMLRDAAVPVLITQNGLLERLASGDRHTICLDSDRQIIAACPDANPPLRCRPDDLAYVIYTSGSTGLPKGVMITQRNLGNACHAYREAYYSPEISGHLQMANPAFDVFTGDWIRALCNGVKLVLCPGEFLSMPDRLYQLMKQEQVEFADFVPAVIRQLNGYLRQNQLRLDFMKICVIGSDTCHIKEFREFQGLCGDKTRLISAYGVTEATIDNTYSATVDMSLPDDAIVPIGKPLANTRIYILDGQQNLAPIGVPGEMYIAGAGVAKGYLNRPELTAEKFVTLNIAGESRYLYKTGDAARWLPDGNIAFLGRLDNQVKLRGLRIELGEIEAALLRHESVNEAVAALGEKDGNPYLAAYVTLLKPVENLAHALRAWLEPRLPNYMTPNFFVELEAFPLTPNGKINRKTLPEPTMQLTQSRYVAPRDSLELRMALLWENILGISPISIKDNFFDMGGDSLLSIRLISAINREFGVRIPLQGIFQSGTVEQLASLLRRDGAFSAWSPLVCLQAQGSKSPIFCVHAAGGIVFRYLQVASLLGKERPFYGIQARGIEPGDEPYDSIEDMAADYARAIRAIQPRGPYLLSGWSLGGTVAFEIARILEREGESVPYLMMIDAPSPYVEGYVQDEVEFLLERLRPAAGLALENVYEQGSREAQLQYLFEEQKLAGLFAADIDMADAELRLKIHMHHNKIICDYRPAGAFNGKIIFFKPTEKIPFDTQMKNPIPAWKEFARDGIEIHDAPGNHFNMFSPVNGPVLAEKMKACLEEIEPSLL